ncbi:MAG: septal ring lytic transglycosylase RlpA family protein [Symploca sp. SIO2C1]|nr:septal ring lytic transglycosylase RlpA family protein [Symploca sp. SIO2C1]
MPFSGLVWLTSWISCLLASSETLLKVPDYLVSTFPESVLSVASRPLERPTTQAFSTQLYPKVGFSNISIASVSSLPFEVATGSFLQSQHFQATARSSEHVANVASNVTNQVSEQVLQKRFCLPESQKETKPTIDSLILATETSPSAARIEVKSTPDDSKTKLSEQILQVMQNLFSWRKRVEPVTEGLSNSVAVISTHSPPVTDKQKGQRVKRGFWRYSQVLTGEAVLISNSEQPEQFYVKVKGSPVVQFPKREQAEVLAQNLKQFFSEIPESDFNPSTVEPALVDGVPVVKGDDRIMFKVDDIVANDLENNQELLAIEWANNLRTVFGQEPLKLVEAQKRMYNLVETSKKVQGVTSWYGGYFHGRTTANGEKYNQHAFTAAHPSLPFDTYLKVKNGKNGDSVIVRINDRGPYISGRNLDLSLGAARCINSEEIGIVPFDAVILVTDSN